MLKAIKMIIGRKCVERKFPLIATAYEVFAATGLTREQQSVEASRLAAAGTITIGDTFNDVYYSLP